MVRWLERLLFVLEIAIAAVLVVLVGLALAAIGVRVVSAVDQHLSGPALAAILDMVFTAFILIELLGTAVAALHGRFVVKRVLEAALLAVSRKLVLVDIHTDGLPVAIGIALLLVAVAAGWLLLHRAGAIGRPGGSDTGSSSVSGRVRDP